MPSVPTPPAVPPAAPAPVAAAPLPVVKKPKLSRIQRNAINGALEGVQEWAVENEPAIRAQAHALLDRVLKPVGEYIAKAHPAVDDVVAWVAAKVAAAKV